MNLDTAHLRPHSSAGAHAGLERGGRAVLRREAEARHGLAPGERRAAVVAGLRPGREDLRRHGGAGQQKCNAQRLYANISMHFLRIVWYSVSSNLIYTTQSVEHPYTIISKNIHEHSRCA